MKLAEHRATPGPVALPRTIGESRSAFWQTRWPASGASHSGRLAHGV